MGSNFQSDNALALKGVIWCLKSPATRLLVQQFVQAHNAKTMEVPHYWPSVRDTIGHRWSQSPHNGAVLKEVSMSWHAMTGVNKVPFEIPNSHVSHMHDQAIT